MESIKIKSRGTRKEVWNGLAKMTSGGLQKEDLIINKHSKIVSLKMSQRAKENYPALKAKLCRAKLPEVKQPEVPLKSLVYFGAGWDMQPLSKPLFKSFNHFIFIDALPKIPHYKPNQPNGYKHSKDRESFVNAITKGTSRRKYKVISDKGNHLVFENPEGKTLDYFINTTVEESLNNPVIRKMFETVRWIHVKGFYPFEYGLTTEIMNTLMPNMYQNLAALMEDDK